MICQKLANISRKVQIGKSRSQYAVERQVSAQSSASAYQPTRISKSILKRLKQDYSFRQVVEGKSVAFAHASTLSLGSTVGKLSTAFRRLRGIQNQIGKGVQIPQTHRQRFIASWTTIQLASEHFLPQPDVDCILGFIDYFRIEDKQLENNVSSSPQVEEAATEYHVPKVKALRAIRAQKSTPEDLGTILQAIPDSVPVDTAIEVLITLHCCYNKKGRKQFTQVVKKQTLQKTVQDMLKCLRYKNVDKEKMSSICKAVNAAAKLNVKFKAVNSTLTPVIETFIKGIQYASPSDIVVMYWSVAKLRYSNESFYDACMKNISRHVDHLTCHECANMLQAMGRAKFGKRDCTLQIIDRMREVLPDAQTHNYVQSIWGLSKLSKCFVINNDTADLYDNALEHLEDMDCRSVAMILYSSGKLHWASADDCQDMVDQMMQFQGNWKPWQASIALFGLSQAGLDSLPASGGNELVACVVDNLHNAGVDRCACAIDGLSLLVEGDDPRLKKIVERYVELKGKATESSRHNIAGLLLNRGFVYSKLIEEINDP